MSQPDQAGARKRDFGKRPNDIQPLSLTLAQDVHGVAPVKRAMTADTDLRLCRFFGLPDGWSPRLQADCDTQIARAGLAKPLERIRPWKEATEQTADPH